jgi:hypothetical protein
MSFEQMSFEQMSFGQMSFEQMSFEQMSFEQMSLEQMWQRSFRRGVSQERESILMVIFIVILLAFSRLLTHQ